MVSQASSSAVHYLAVLMTVMDADAPPLDLILVPGVAFDKDCNRVCYHFIF